MSGDDRRRGRSRWAGLWDALDLAAFVKAVRGLLGGLVSPKAWVGFCKGLWEELELPRTGRQSLRGLAAVLNPINWVRGAAWLWNAIDLPQILRSFSRLPAVVARGAGASSVTAARSSRPLILIFLPLLFISWLVVGGGGKTDPRLKIARTPLRPPSDPAASQIAQLQKLMDQGGGTSSLHAQLARSYLQDGRLRDAAGEYADALKADQKNTDAYLGIMNVAASVKDTKAAVELAKRAYGVDREDPEILNRLGASLAADGQPEEAVKYFLLALKRSPNSVVILLNLGAAYAQLSNWSEADAYCAKAMAAAPKDEIPALLRALIRLRNHGGPEAVEMLERVVATHPGSAYATQALASALLDTGNTAAAMKSFEKAQTLKSDWIMPYLGAGLAGLQAQSWSDAERNFSRALQLSPESIVGRLGMASVLESKGRDAEAIVIYKQVLAGQPNLYMALNNLAYHYAEKGENLDAAYSMARSAALSFPQDRSGWDTLGWVCFKLGRKDESVQYLLKASQMGPKNGVTHYHLAKALFAAGRVAESKAAFATAVGLSLPLQYSHDAELKAAGMR